MKRRWILWTAFDTKSGGSHTRKIESVPKCTASDTNLPVSAWGVGIWCCFFMALIPKRTKTVLKQAFLVPVGRVWPGRNEYDGQRKEADPGAAPFGRSPGSRPSEAAQGPDEKAHSRGGSFGKGSAADDEHEFERVGNISSQTYKLSAQSRSVPVCRGVPLFRPEGRTYSPPASGRWYCLRQSCALRGGCGPCGGLPGMTAVISGAYGTSRRAALFYTPAKTCHWQLFAVYGGRRTGDEKRR